MTAFRKFVDLKIIEWESLRSKGENKESLELYVALKTKGMLLDGYKQDVKIFLSFSSEIRKEILEKYSGQTVDNPLDKIS